MPPIERRGRSSAYNPANRYERYHYEEDPEALSEEERRQVKTEVRFDDTKTILARNSSPDVGFTFSVNPYRGCEHGCIYCYARPTHEFLGLSAGLDFESVIVVKRGAPRLLAEAFDARGWEPQVVALAGNTDPYQPLERSYELTRGCLEVFAAYRNPVGLITKNFLVTRDLDVLTQLAADHLVGVTLSITTLDADLARVMEPRASMPARRLEAVARLADAGVPVGVNIAPVIPGLTDEEIPAILRAAAERGASFAGFGMLRLPGAVRELFIDWLRRHFPAREQRILGRLRDIHGPELTRSEFGMRMRGRGPYAEAAAQLFRSQRDRLGLSRPSVPMTTARFRRPSDNQLSLFEA